ncbi:hypothetical protein F5B22DRAFT_654606 [Xylaria bambusicola]|uniref:uncharacterized protein n=1 Tax=Xylaria bambusicola TaxID=326684 RepID=UPI00200757B8|nr:uncharacterized protein F5B22DRAFT_654606 [Xylaria bambusicola]KAI0517854.1 hypothetical protein F5B22DRAFT_654606 [Xylaria bambusicola]
MHFTSSILSTLAVASVVNSYAVDPDLRDGLYYIPLTPGSTHEVASYGEPHRLDVYESLNSRGPLNGLSERHVIGKVPFPTDTHICYNSVELQPEYEGATKILNDWCDSGKTIPRHIRWNAGLILSRYGSSMAWVCSLGGRQGCAPNEIENTWSQISDKCNGTLSGGEVCASGWKKCYGHSTVKGEICGNTT